VHVLGVGGVHLSHFLQAAHAIGFFGAEQVPLAGMHAHDFSGRSNLETLGGAAVRLEFELLYLFCHELDLTGFPF
jgi:hypothetical protein